MSEISFIDSWFLWLDAIVAAGLSAFILSILGVWIILKRSVYVPLALSQVSSLGVILAFLLGDILVLYLKPENLLNQLVAGPFIVSLLFAALVSLYFAKAENSGKDPTVTAYLISASLALIAGNFIRQDLHDVDSLLFGNAVLVERMQVYLILCTTFIILFLQIVLYRRFLFAIFDPDSAAAVGLKVKTLNFLMYICFAFAISVTTRAIGALPVFGFSIFPALAGLKLGKSMKTTFIISAICGIISAITGYYLSFILELPSGATMVTLAGLIYFLAHFIAKGLSRAA